MANRRKSSRGGVHRPQSYAEPKPIAGPDAFRSLTDPNSVYSQAATMLLIGSHLRGDPAASRARAQAALGATIADAGIIPPATEPIPETDLAALGFPGLRADAGRFRAEDLQSALGVHFGTVKAGKPSPKDAGAATDILPAAASRFYADANIQTAAALLEAGLRHPNELVRCAAAASYFEVASEAAKAIVVLEHGVGSKDPLTSDVAAYALAHIDPLNLKLLERLRAKRRVSRRKPSRTSTIVHGTWAASSGWWQPPKGDFWTYVHDNVDASLYAAQDRFEWSGGYSDAARIKAGTEFNAWVQKHNLNGLDAYAHSHGGSVSMLANHLGTQVGKLILLSCPVHWPKYSLDFTRVTKVVSVRVHLDLVILADRGGQKFTDARIEEHVLPVWFDHFATHTPAVWDKYGVRQWVLAGPSSAVARSAAPATVVETIAEEIRQGLKKPIQVSRPIKLKQPT